jgi:glyoxylase-like metal-dependent hydrolase (beta-lactamase superfamily II)
MYFCFSPNAFINLLNGLYMLKIKIIETGFFKLDGGAMFGIVPKRLWSKLNPPDENNLCTWAMRCLLVETGEHKILIDTGLGSKQDEKFRIHFEPFGTDSLLQSIENQGVKPEDITDVFLTHLHFDHCGGALMKNSEGRLIPTFPNATYWSNKKHWAWAMKPNAREAASFLKENFVPLKEQGVLKFVDVKEGIELFPDFHVHFSNGHTHAMMMVKMQTADKTYFYCADTIPSAWHIPMPYVMAYDVRPLETLKEKAKILETAVAENWHLIFEHDPETVCATVKKNEAGKIVIDKTFDLT